MQCLCITALSAKKDSMLINIKNTSNTVSDLSAEKRVCRLTILKHYNSSSIHSVLQECG